MDSFKSRGNKISYTYYKHAMLTVLFLWGLRHSECAKLWANWASPKLNNLSALQRSCAPSYRLFLPTTLQCLLHQDYKIFYKPDSKYMLKHYHNFTFFSGVFFVKSKENLYMVNALNVLPALLLWKMSVSIVNLANFWTLRDSIPGYFIKTI